MTNEQTRADRQRRRLIVGCWFCRQHAHDNMLATTRVLLASACRRAVVRNSVGATQRMLLPPSSSSHMRIAKRDMSVRIRLARFGRKKRPFYRIRVADSRSPRDGKFIEAVGTYDPLPSRKDNMKQVRLNRERIEVRFFSVRCSRRQRGGAWVLRCGVVLYRVVSCR